MGSPPVESLRSGYPSYLTLLESRLEIQKRLLRRGTVMESGNDFWRMQP